MSTSGLYIELERELREQYVDYYKLKHEVSEVVMGIRSLMALGIMFVQIVIGLALLLTIFFFPFGIATAILGYGLLKSVEDTYDNVYFQNSKIDRMNEMNEMIRYGYTAQARKQRYERA